jgi:hypothetical protein
MPRTVSRTHTVKQRLNGLRIIYTAILLTQVVYLLMVLFGLLPHEGSQRQMRSILGLVDWAMLVSTVPITLLVRAVVFGSTRGPEGIPVGNYAFGNIVFWAGCEAVTFVSLTIVYLTASARPGMVIAAIGFILQLATFPRASRVSRRSQDPL